MYTKGHCGVSLLVYAPVGVGLTVFGHGPTALAGGVVMLVLAMLPDCDHCLPVDHRGPTHTLAFALFVGLFLGTVAVTYAATPSSGAGLTTGLFAFAIGTLAVLAHLVADLLTPMGVAPFWPASNRRYTLDVTPAKDPRANNALLGVGAAVTIAGAYLLELVA